MNTPGEIKPRADLRDYLAAERTFLAWIRTGLALMGFGFVVARFGLFLQQLQIFRQDGRGSSSRAFFLVRHSAHRRGSDRGSFGRAAARPAGSSIRPRRPRRSRPLAQNIAIALFLALVGLAMAIYLVSVRSSSTSTHSENSKEVPMARAAPASGNGIVNRPSNHSVEETVERLKSILQSEGSHALCSGRPQRRSRKGGHEDASDEAADFRQPQGGDACSCWPAPSIAIDLPLKILVREDSQGKVWISYDSPEYLSERHGLPQELFQNIAVVETLATKAGE